MKIGTENSPLVSICIPVFNTILYIEETINCFLNQSYKNIEIIVQDDCSTDGTWQLLLEKYLKNPCIRLYRNELNKGVGENWNVCYEKSSGDYVIMANADDIYDQKFIAQSISIFNKNQFIDVVQFGHEILFDNNHNKKRSAAQISLNNGLIYDPFDLVFFSNPFLFQFAISKRSILEKAKL
jgi:glycosyltransferase involved in cell wall biosynthesis